MFTRGYPAENSWCLWMLSPFRWSHFEVLTHPRFCINQPLHLPFTDSFTHKSPAVKLLRPPSLLRRFCKGSKPNDLRYLSNFVLEKWEKSKIPPSSGRNSDENLPIFTCKNKLNFWDDTAEVGIHMIQVHAQHQGNDNVIHLLPINRNYCWNVTVSMKFQGRSHSNNRAWRW